MKSKTPKNSILQRSNTIAKVHWTDFKGAIENVSIHTSNKLLYDAIQLQILSPAIVMKSI